MIPLAVAGVALAGAALSAAVLLAQPGEPWRAAAEHSRPFWLGWAIAGLAVAFAAPPIVGVGWAGSVWIVFWVTVGSAQPSLLLDLTEVRRLRRRRRELQPSVMPADPAPARIAWRAPGVA